MLGHGLEGEFVDPGGMGGEGEGDLVGDHPLDILDQVLQGFLLGRVNTGCLF